MHDARLGWLAVLNMLNDDTIDQFGAELGLRMWLWLGGIGIDGVNLASCSPRLWPVGASLVTALAILVLVLWPWPENVEPASCSAELVALDWQR